MPLSDAGLHSTLDVMIGLTVDIETKRIVLTNEAVLMTLSVIFKSVYALVS